MNNNFRTFVVYAVNQGKVMIIKLWFYYALMHIFDASTKAHSQPCQTSKMERFAKVVDGKQIDKQMLIKIKVITQNSLCIDAPV